MLCCKVLCWVALLYCVSCVVVCELCCVVCCVGFWGCVVLCVVCVELFCCSNMSPLHVGYALPYSERRLSIGSKDVLGALCRMLNERSGSVMDRERVRTLMVSIFFLINYSKY